MGERALITGVTGFVGRHLCQHLLASGDDVLGTAERPPPRSFPWGALPNGDRILIWDLGDPQGPPKNVLETIREFAPSVVYHLAAISVPEECGSHEPTELARAVNVEGTRRLIDLVRRISGPPRLIFVSTSHVYTVPQTQVTFVHEGHPVQPRNAYGRTKHAAEQLLLEALHVYGLPVLIVRAFPHTGPGQSEKMMLPGWAAQFARHESPVKVHTLHAFIDLCDVRDVVRAYRLLATLGTPGEVYHVGSGVARTSGEVFHMLQQLADCHSPVLETRPGTKYDPIAITEKITRATGWRPSIPLAATVADTYQWWLEKVRVEGNPQSAPGHV